MYVCMHVCDYIFYYIMLPHGHLILCRQHIKIWWYIWTCWMQGMACVQWTSLRSSQEAPDTWGTSRTRHLGCWCSRALRRVFEQIRRGKGKYHTFRDGNPVNNESDMIMIDSELFIAWFDSLETSDINGFTQCWRLGVLQNHVSGHQIFKYPIKYCMLSIKSTGYWSPQIIS